MLYAGKGKKKVVPTVEKLDETVKDLDDTINNKHSDESTPSDPPAGKADTDEVEFRYSDKNSDHLRLG